MPPASFNLDTREFDKTLETYRKFSRRDEVEIVNTKAYFIARRAVVETYKADKGKIRAFFGRETQKIVGMIINKRRGERGEKGLYGDAMAEAQALMMAKRLRAVYFMRSGWIWVIKGLESYVKSKRGAARNVSSVKAFGQPKGKAIPARPSLSKVVAVIKNFAHSKKSTTEDPLGVYGMPGLQRAVNLETASMRDYIEQKLKKSAHGAGIKTK